MCSLLDINSLKMFIASADFEKIEKENSSNASFLFFSFWLLGTSKRGKSSISDSHNSQITEFEEEKCLSKDPTLYHPLNIQDTAQGIDYTLKEYNTLFKQFEKSTSPSIEEWTRVASMALTMKKLIKKQSKDYNFEYRLYSKPGAPDSKKRIES